NLDQRRSEYEIKKAALKAAVAESEAADNARDEARERWLKAVRLVNLQVLHEDEVRRAKLTWDNKTCEANSKRAAADKAQAEADRAKGLLASVQQAEQTLQNASENNETQARVPAQFPHAIRFKQGATQFLDGDNITIEEVRGTADVFLSGNIYWIRGSYKL